MRYGQSSVLFYNLMFYAFDTGWQFVGRPVQGQSDTKPKNTGWNKAKYVRKRIS